MPTYRTSARNQFRTPSGAVGDAPDGPGGMAALSDDVDAYLGVGGAEYCATTLDSVAPGRKFKGKLAYHAPSDVTYRYVGAGNTALGATNASAVWQAWEKPAVQFTPSLTNLTGTNSVNAAWGISAGLLYCMLDVVSGSGYGITAATDVTCTLPSPFIANYLAGRGTYYRGGTTNNNVLWDLVAFYPVFGVQSSTTFRIRALVTTSATAGQPTAANQLGNVILSPYTSDRFTLEARAPSALVY